MRREISEAEKEICGRLKELRGKLGLTEIAAAAAVGISKHLWHNYEVRRAPLRCDVALRICRELIVSEEWLATGRFDALEAIAGKGKEMSEIYFRQCLDLRAEPEFLQLPPGTLFSDAYTNVLSAKYGELTRAFHRLPRLVLTDSDSDGLLVRYLTVVEERFFLMLRNESRRLKKEESLVCRQFLRCQIDFGTVLFKRFIGLPTPEIVGNRFDYLRALIGDAKHPLGALHGASEGQQSGDARPTSTKAVETEAERGTVTRRTKRARAFSLATEKRKEANKPRARPRKRNPSRLTGPPVSKS
jgi:DNA-binding XRE family transcriptional regulator